MVVVRVKLVVGLGMCMSHGYKPQGYREGGALEMCEHKGMLSTFAHVYLCLQL